jgi:hypothetical protein
MYAEKSWLLDEPAYDSYGVQLEKRFLYHQLFKALRRFMIKVCELHVNNGAFIHCANKQHEIRSTTFAFACRTINTLHEMKINDKTNAKQIFCTTERATGLRPTSGAIFFLKCMATRPTADDICRNTPTFIINCIAFGS